MLGTDSLRVDIMQLQLPPKLLMAYIYDLNPIEHLWDEIDCQLRKRDLQPANLQEVSDAIQHEGNWLPHYK